MRARSVQTVSISSGRLLICDPLYLFDLSEMPPYLNVPEGVALFDDFGGDGTFKAYRDGKTLVVDTAPRQFKAKTRPGFCLLPGVVSIDTGMIVVLDASYLGESNEDISDDFLVVDWPNGEFRAWMERKDTSRSFRNSILAVGPSVHLLMHGSSADLVAEIENQVARALKLKGFEKEKAIASLRKEILGIHNSGKGDHRLSLIASFVGVDLPPLSKKHSRGAGGILTVRELKCLNILKKSWLKMLLV